MLVHEVPVLDWSIRCSKKTLTSSWMIALVTWGLGCTGAPLPEVPQPAETLLTAVGDVSPEGAIAWGGASQPSWIWAAVGEDAAQPTWVSSPVHVDKASDFSASIPIDRLRPATKFHLTLVALASPSTGHAPAVSTESWLPDGAIVGHAQFTSAPDPAAPMPVTLLVGGDLGGQQYCSPYPIFSAMAAQKADFWIANGDLIYADGDCPAKAPDGRANALGDFPSIAQASVNWSDPNQTRDVFTAHWRYNRSDEAFRGFLSTTPMVAQWDDHEIINDFGAQWQSWGEGGRARAGFPNLVETGREAFFAYNPIRRSSEEPNRIYRSIRWGQHLELFVADARSYRSPNTMPDGPDKTLLGTTQRQWLIDGVLGSSATWKVITIDVPISVPTGTQPEVYGRDGWADGHAQATEGATGAEQELQRILRAWDEAKVRNLVFVTTDVHFARSTAYAVDLNGDGEALKFHEFISGPLRAWAGQPGGLDPTFGPTVLYEEGPLANFAMLSIDPQQGTTLTATVLDEGGKVRPGSRISVVASP